MNLTAQLPRATQYSGNNTERQEFVSPKVNRNSDNQNHRGSTEVTKKPYLLASENIQSSAKPPKFKRDLHSVSSIMMSTHMKSQRYLQDQGIANQPNKSLERRGSLERLDTKHKASRNHSKMASTQSLSNLTKFIDHNGFKDNRNLDNAQEKINELFTSLE